MIKNKAYIIVGIISVIMSFILWIIGVKGILGQNITSRNIVAYLIFSILVGIISALFIFIKWRYAFYIFAGGLIVGFIMMYYSFYSDTSGWGDLLGVFTILAWSGIGLVVGMVTQIIVKLFKKKA